MNVKVVDQAYLCTTFHEQPPPARPIDVLQGLSKDSLKYPYLSRTCSAKGCIPLSAIRYPLHCLSAVHPLSLLASASAISAQAKFFSPLLIWVNDWRTKQEEEEEEEEEEVEEEAAEMAEEKEEERKW